MFILKHLLYSDDVSRLKMRNVKNEYLFTNRNNKKKNQQDFSKKCRMDNIIPKTSQSNKMCKKIMFQ